MKHKATGDWSRGKETREVVRIAAEAEKIRVQLEIRQIQSNHEIELCVWNEQSVYKHREALVISARLIGARISNYRCWKTIKMILMLSRPLWTYMHGVQCAVGSAEWSTRFAQLLKSTTVEVFQRISDDDFGDYQTLLLCHVEALLSDRSGYREWRKNSHIESGETPDQVDQDQVILQSGGRSGRFRRCVRKHRNVTIERSVLCNMF